MCFRVGNHGFAGGHGQILAERRTPDGCQDTGIDGNH